MSIFKGRYMKQNHSILKSEQEVSTIKFYLEQFKRVIANVGKICFIHAVTNEKYGGLWILGLNGVPELMVVAMNIIEIDQDEGCKKVYSFSSAVVSFFCASTASIFAAANVENKIAKAAEGTEILLSISTDCLETIETWQDQEHSMCYKIMESVYTLIAQSCNIGFFLVLCSEEFGDVEVIKLGDTTITFKELFPIINITHSISSMGYTFIKNRFSNHPTLFSALKNLLCPQRKKIMLTQTRLFQQKNYGTFKNTLTRTRVNPLTILPPNQDNQSRYKVKLFQDFNGITKSLELNDIRDPNKMGTSYH